MTCYLAQLEGCVWSEPHESSVWKYEKSFSFFGSEILTNPQVTSQKYLFFLESVAHNSLTECTFYFLNAVGSML